ncbi:hypothetical protein [Acidianus hospitalis]|nr:hypothetical protein [Acidianus hospitalis]
MPSIPFYVISNLMIDAYFIDKISQKEDRILLIRSKKEGKETGEIKPIPFNLIISLMREGYEEVSKQDFKSLKISEVFESIFYNQSVFIKNREKEITEKVMRRIFSKMYERLFDIINNKYDKVTWLEICIRQDKIFLENTYDEIYTRLFRSDEKFRNELLKLFAKS